jgi:hypothetical protein
MIAKDEARARRQARALLKGAGFEASAKTAPPPWDEPIPSERDAGQRLKLRFQTALLDMNSRAGQI